MIPVKVQKLNEAAILPQYMTTGSAGCDAYALVEAPMTIAPGQRVAIPTGLAFEIPVGYEIQVRPRSGLSLKQGLTVVNAPGTIDSDYRGEVKVLMINLGQQSVVVNQGDRIAQFVIQKVEQIEWSVVEDLAASHRGAGGFGSTGVENRTN